MEAEAENTDAASAVYTMVSLNLTNLLLSSNYF